MWPDHSAIFQDSRKKDEERTYQNWNYTLLLALFLLMSLSFMAESGHDGHA